MLRKDFPGRVEARRRRVVERNTEKTCLSITDTRKKQNLLGMTIGHGARIAKAEIVKKEHLKIGASALGVAVIAIGLYFLFRPKAVEPEHFTAAESACLARIGPEFQQLLEAQWARQKIEMQQANHCLWPK